MNNKSVCDSWFATKKISDLLYCINEIHYWEWNRANIWLIKGKTQDLLIDTGLGVASLRQYIASLIDKPLLAIASHVHFDHAGGIHEFDNIAIHTAEAEALRHGDCHAALCNPESGWILDEHFSQLPYAGFTATQYTFQAAEPTQLLQEGDVIDLGDRAFEILHLPGHSPGCIALYDPFSQELFSGDIVYDGDLLDQLPGSDISTYISSYERLQHLPVEIVYPGHYHMFGQQRMQELIADYLEAKRQPGCPSKKFSLNTQEIVKQHTHRSGS
ncbi:MBL fold metallo-hydrolase [Gloeocapsopsis crepidinum LEGE 06123]|uniref:MBL fold metallo-hydrolase n=1 Tax=Gloeocapsopsis crepidinum LEGE 06123 TaxID=588587 RepID=A0ABR9UNR3_9CHRO|nr:MBL fold metallo-hydrolase [Gloeocapsopsis crepidinum]MBE9189265.1 MBL fold metallo-hydrolase [Gloeocapsopsis crepidinum LEGE 06123]